MPTNTLPAFMRNPQITGIVRSEDLPANYLWDRWFPSDPVTADEFESLVILDELHLAPFVAIDTETPTVPDDIIGAQKWQVAYIRHKKVFRESELRVFYEPGLGDPNTLAAANAEAEERKIRRYMALLSQGVDGRKEWMFAEAMAGSIAYNDTHVQYTVNYDGAYNGTTNRKAPTTLWNAASPTIIADLSNWVEELSDEAGIDDWALVTTPKVLGVMARDSGVREMWASAVANPASTAPGSLDPIGQTMVAAALSLLGITEIIRYKAKYSTRVEAAGTATRTKVRFINDNDLFLLPANQALGRMASAPAKPNNHQSGKFGWSEETIDPWVVSTGAGEYTWIDWPATNHNKMLQARVVS
jgi:hypothetical protein